MFICQNAEGVHAYLSKCWRGTLSSVGMLKGYMVKNRLGTHDVRWCLLMCSFASNFPW